MADTLRDLAYGAALRGQMPPPPMPLPDTIARLAMAQGGSVGTPYRTTLANMVGRGGAAAQRLAQALDTVGARIPGTQTRISLKDLTLGDAGQVVEGWSYGSPPMRGGNYATGGIGTLGPTQQAMELLNLGGVAGGTVKGAQLGAKVLGPTLRDMVREGGESFMRGIGAQQDLITWHGSPHTFDRFDASKIGTGEGAQAYGHGLYLAENPTVAKNYTQAGDASAPVVKNWLAEADAAGVPPSESYQWARQEIASRLATAKSPGVRQTLQDALNRFDELASGGSLYKVDLPDSMIARMLDWDKPLSAQPMAVQDAFNLSKHAPGGPSAAVRDYLGRDAYILSGKRFNNASSDSPEVAAWLRSKSIPGIRYLDGGSRADGLGTSNFVVFPGEESALTILERNGRPLR